MNGTGMKPPCMLHNHHACLWPSPTCCPAAPCCAQVLQLLFVRYLSNADVRYYTLWTVRALSARHAEGAARQRAGSKPAAAAAPAGAGEQAGNGAAEPGPARKKGRGQSQTEAAPASAQQATTQGASAAVCLDTAAGALADQPELPQQEGSLELSLPDLCRNLFDVLMALPAALTGCSRWEQEAEGGRPP